MRSSGDFEVGEVLGEGGMGVVYAGTHRRTGHPVAIKRIRPELARQPRLREAFEAEAWTVGRLDHPGVVRVFHVGSLSGEGDDADDLCIVTERGSGTLADGGRRPWKQLRPLVEHLLRTLAWVHAREVVHGDLSPSNVLVGCRAGSRPLPTPLAGVRLTDFGLSHRVGEDGVAGGTPGFAAPEELAGAPSSVRGDLYALGRVVQALLDGIPAPVGAWLGRLTATDPAARPASAAEALLSLPGDDGADVLPAQPVIEDEQTRAVWSVVAEPTPSEPIGGRWTPVQLPERWRRRGIVDPRQPAWTLSPALLAARELPLVGRDAVLDAAWEHIRDPRVRVVALHGADGVGASAVRRELVRRVAEAGGVGWVVDGSPAARLPGLPSPDAPDHADALLGALDEVSAGRPLAIAVERPTDRRWLERLAALPDTGPDLPLTVLVDQSLPGRGARVVEVPPLAWSAMLELLQEVLRLEPGWARRLAEAVDGRPGSAVRWVHRLAVRGALRSTETGLAVDPELERPRPDEVRDLPPLSPPIRDALERLALMPPALRSEADDLLGTDPSAVWRSLRAAGVLADRRTVDPDAVWAARATAEASGRARAHHAAVARWLADRDLVDPYEVAVHEIEAGRAADGLRRVARAFAPFPHLLPTVVDRGGALLAPHRAVWGAAGPRPEIAALRLGALSHIGRVGGTDEADLARAETLAEDLGDDDLLAHVRCDQARRLIRDKQPTAAREVLERLLPLADADRVTEETAERIAMVRALVLLWSYEPACVPAAEALVARCGAFESMGWTMLSDWHHARGEPEAALRFARRGAAVVGGRYALESLTTLAVALRAVDEVEEATEVLAEVERRATRTADWPILSRALMIRSHLRRSAGDGAGAAEALLRARDLHALSGRRNPVATLVLGLVYGGSLRRLDELARLTPDGFGLPVAEQSPPLRAPVVLHRFMVAVGLGELDGLDGWLDELERCMDERQGPMDPDGIWLMEALAEYAGPASIRARMAALAADQRARLDSSEE